MGEENTEITDSGINPAWNDLMQELPEEYHDKVIPHLKGWDQNFTQQVQSVQSEWDDFRFLKDDDISPDDARIALGVLRAVQEDPRAVYDSLAESYGFNESEPDVNPTEGQGETEPNSGIPPEILQQLEELKSGYNTMAEILLQQKQEKEEAEQDALLQRDIASMKQKHGAFDERFVLGEMREGASAEQAISAYNDLVQRILTEKNKPEPPMLLGSSSSGGIPGEKRLDVTKMSDDQTRQHVLKYLESQARANQ